MEKNIKIKIPEGYNDAVFDKETNEIKFIKNSKLGDKVTIDGVEGYILEVDDAGEPTVLCSEYLGAMSWNDAMKKVNQGIWHLPTVEEWKKYYKVVIKLDNNEWNYYLTSTEYNSLCIYTNNACINSTTKTDLSPVRAFAYVGKKKDRKPRSWEEYCEQVKNTGCYICVQDSVMPYSRVSRPQYNEFDTEEEAKAFIALGKLIKLHKAWVKDWRPNWADATTRKFVIFYKQGALIKDYHINYHRILAFPTAEMRDEFLETFHNIIEEAKPLL